MTSKTVFNIIFGESCFSTQPVICARAFSKVLPNMVFPRFRGKNWCIRMQVNLDSLFSRSVINRKIHFRVLRGTCTLSSALESHTRDFFFQRSVIGLSTSCSATFWQLFIFRATFSSLKAGSHMIAPIVSVASVVCKVWGDWSKQTFWSNRSDRDDRDDHMRTRLKQLFFSRATYCILSSFQPEDLRRLSECCSKGIRTFPKIYEVCRGFSRNIWEFQLSAHYALKHYKTRQETWCHRYLHDFSQLKKTLLFNDFSPWYVI